MSRSRAELNRRLSYQASHDVADRARQPARVRDSASSGRSKSAKAQASRHHAALLSSISTSSRSSTTPAATPPATSCCGRSARCCRRRCAGATRWRASAATSSACCSRAARWSEALRIAESLREAIARIPLHLGGPRFRLGVSIGVVPINADERGRGGVLSARRHRLLRGEGEGPQPRAHLQPEDDIDLMRRRARCSGCARINSALDESRFELYSAADPAAGGRTTRGDALRAAAAHARRERRASSPPDELHRRGRALRHHAARSTAG